MVWLGAIGIAQYNTGVSSICGGPTWLTFIHETGHNFGLNHTFQLGQGTTGGFMDYGDGKINGVYGWNLTYCATEYEKEVSRAATATATTTQTRLSSCNSIGAPITDFLSDKINLCSSGSIQFRNNSIGGPTSWSWTFQDGIPAISTGYNPLVSFSTPGVKSVILTTNNGNGTSTITKNIYVSSGMTPAICVNSGVVASTAGNDVGPTAFILNTINKSSGGSRTDGNKYFDYTCFNSTILKAGNTYNVTISGNYSDLYMQFFIDYNDDGDFLDSNETIYNGKAATGSITFLFRTPSVLPVVNKMLRARVTSTAFQTSLNSCFNPAAGDGQIEDYGVLIESTSPVVPTFTSIAPICYGGTITLSTTSTNAITGTWSPAVNNTATTTYTFTPTPGLYASTVTVTVTVNQYNTATLSSAVGTNAQTKCINTAITNITYATTGTTGATFSGLPTGVIGLWSGNVASIIGTPSVSGTFNYTVTLIGGCPSVNAKGTIIVTPLLSYYQDADGDGYGNIAVSKQVCVPLSGYVTNNTDCDDANANSYTSTFHTTAISVCGAYTWDVANGGSGATYTISGNYPYTKGCHTETLALTIQNINTIATQPADKTICKAIGGTAIFSVVPIAPDVTYQWYTQAATATTWTLVANSVNYSGATTANLNVTKSSTTVPATGTKYKVVVTSSCGITTSNIVSISDLTVLSKAAAITVAGTLSPLLTACQGNSVNLSLAAGSIGNIQWQSSTDGISYSNTGTPIAQSVLSATNLAIPFNTGALTQTTWFRVVASNGVCSAINGTPIKITVSAPANAGSISGGGVTVCAPLTSGFDANGNTLTTSITNKTVLTLNGATVGATMVWQKSTNYVNTTNAAPVWASAGSTTNSIIANALTADAWYRVQVTIGACVAYTNPVKITVTKSAVAGVVTATTNGIVTTSVCTGGDITFTSAAYVGSSIKWEVSTTSATTGFQAVAGANQLVFTMNTVSYAPLSKFYVRSVVTSGNCTLARSLVKTITVNPLPVVSTATGGGTICSGAKGTLALSGYAGTIQWESSADGTNYVNVPIGLATAATTYVSGSATGSASTYLASAIKGDTYFRAKVTSGPCAVVYSNVIKYTIATVTASITLTTSNTAVCSGTGTTLTLTGSITPVKWFKSINWTSATPTWTAVTTSTLPTLATGNLTASTAYKAETTIGACSTLSTSGIVTVMFNSASLAKTITANVTSPTGTSSALAICSGVVKTLTIGTGSIGAIQWQKSITSTTLGFTDIADAISTSFTIVSPAVGANYLRAKFTNSCGVSVYGVVFTVYYKDCPQTKIVADLGTTSFKVTGYPNPYTNTFQLDITTQSNATVTVMVYNMIGKLIEVRNSGISELGTMEIGDRYATGVYNVMVTQGTEVKTLRMIKK